MFLNNSADRVLPYLGIEIDNQEFDELKFKKDQLIYCEGSTSLGAYFVKSGKVKVRKTGSGGKDQIIRIATSGDLINFTELPLHNKFSSTAQALEDAVLYFIDKWSFDKLLNEHIKLSEQFILLLSKELSSAEVKIADMAFKPVKARLAATLVYLFKKYNTGKQNSSILVSRKDLAGYTGTAKETVNRLLAEFRNEKLISTKGTQIDILNLNGLKSIKDLHN